MHETPYSAGMPYSLPPPMTFVKFTYMIISINLVNDMTTKLNKIDLNLFCYF